MTILHETILNLSLDDLRQWAGSKILNRGKSYQNNVYDLARTEDGGLLAWVSGTDDYETWVGVDDDGGLDHFCTCPYDWGVCKHAVALLLTGLAEVKDGAEISLADDDRMEFFAVSEDDEDDGYDDCGQSHNDTTAVSSILQKMKKAELLAMLTGFAQQYPEVKRDILETDQLQSGDIEKLVCSLATEIDEVTSEEAYYNHWRDEGSLPDYDHIHQQLSALLNKGHADEVVKLGKQLWQQGSEQVGHSHDDGQTAEEVAGCMDIIFAAVESSSMTKTEQLLWSIDIFLEDDYSLSDAGREYIYAEHYRKEHWQEVTSVLQDRLDKTRKPTGSDDYSGRYHREQVMNWLITAFEESGREELVLPLLEKEAHTVQCYGRVVDILLDDGKVAQAREWCIKGYERTKNSAAHIASSLQKKLRELARQDNKPELAASYLAQDFFASPGLQNYLDLQKACKEIECWPNVHAGIMKYLENGQRPDLSGRKSWPLPAPDVVPGEQRFQPDFPIHGVLIDIAIHEKRLDDVVALYRQQKGQNRLHGSRDKQIAEAVAKSHPEVSLAIWQRLALGQINLVKPAAYEVAATYLGKMRRVYEQTEQLAIWQDLITAIRTEHKRRRRLLEVLDSLIGKRLID